MSGVYRINPERSDALYSVVASASSKLPFAEQQKFFVDLADMRGAWRTVLPKWENFDRAERLLRKYSLSFWDAMIVAACLEGGVTRLYSEDFDDSARAEGLEVVNPFAAS